MAERLAGLARTRLAALAAVASVAVGCDGEAPARDQWRIVIGTDAVVPQFGDRLLIEIVDEQGEVCSSCRRQFGAADPAIWPLSIGVVSEGKRLGVRVRLYRAAITGSDGFPGSDRHLDAFAWLPEISGVAEVGLSLRMACFGRLADVAGGRSCDPSTGQLAPAATLEAVDDAEREVARPGSWSEAGPFGCEGGSPEPGMVCIPGGAFLLGSPRFLPIDVAVEPSPEQLVRLSPFLLDQDEMTVGALRPLVDAGLVGAPLVSVATVDGEPDRCTWDAGDLALPVNCAPLEVARAACAALGKRLPTEAEWEYAASNLQAETKYPWRNEDADGCTQAVVDQRKGRCRPSGEHVGPLPGGSPLDVTSLGVNNLAGNVNEWVEGTVSPYADPTCWGPSPDLHVDPVCADGRFVQAFRGGAWDVDPHRLDVSSRDGSDGPSEARGFRCAKSPP